MKDVDPLPHEPGHGPPAPAHVLRRRVVFNVEPRVWVCAIPATAWSQTLESEIC